jgi:1,2-diacylglycerol 3-beta-galactosyltransferase
MDLTARARRVLILIAHTGSGHLRAAEAVSEALRRRYGVAAVVEVLDAVGDYAPFPFCRLADLYPRWIDQAQVTWDWGYKLTDGPRRAKGLLRLFWPLVWPRARRLLCQYPADVIVSVHPLTNHYVMWALQRLGRGVPTATLVTDPVSVHPFWFSPDVDCCLVGSAEAQRKALACGCKADRVRVTGLPVNPLFADGLADRGHARAVLGWALDRPAVLVLGGGEGMGRVYETVCAIDAICPDVQVAVVAGRNRRLQERLEKITWRLPTRVYGFVDHIHEMPLLMSAADVLVTKAGPGSLHEAFLAGLPLVLNGAIPGQEEGNVRLVVDSGAGVWAPDPAHGALLIARWMGAGKSSLTHMAARSRELARPGAAAVVADHIWQLALTKL